MAKSMAQHYSWCFPLRPLALPPPAPVEGAAEGAENQVPAPDYEMLRDDVSVRSTCLGSQVELLSV